MNYTINHLSQKSLLDDDIGNSVYEHQKKHTEETKRYIEEALSVNPYITKINKIDVDFKTDVLTAYVDLETVYGRLNMYV